MKVQIEIDDDSLNDLVAKGIKNLPDEDIGRLAKEAVQKAFSDEKTMKDIVFQKKETSYYGETRHSDIRPEILAMLNRAFTDDEVKEYRVQLFELLEKNKKELMTEVLAEIFVKRVLEDPYEFMNKMAQKLGRIEQRMD